MLLRRGRRADGRWNGRGRRGGGDGGVGSGRPAAIPVERSNPFDQGLELSTCHSSGGIELAGTRILCREEDGKGISLALIARPVDDSTVASVQAAYQKVGVAASADLRASVLAQPAYKAFWDAIDRSIVQHFTAWGFIVLNTTTDMPGWTVGRSSWDGAVNGVESSGECKMAVGIDFVMWEPLSMQRMWTKSATVEALATNSR